MQVIKIKINGRWHEIENLELSCLNEERYSIDELEDIRLIDDQPVKEECDYDEISKRAEANGEEIMRIAKKYGMNSLDLINASAELKELPNIFNHTPKKIEVPPKIDITFADFEDVLDNRELIIEIINHLNNK